MKFTKGYDNKIRLGISVCLLGQRFRFDGNHKHDSYLSDTLGQFFEWVPVCPEVAIGLGVPRPPIRLFGSPISPRAVDVNDTNRDVTDELTAYGKRQARALKELSGYVFKSRSPSCGMERVKVYHRTGKPTKNGRGIYADAFLATHGLTASRLVDFHTRHKLAHMAHDVEAYRTLGRLIAQAGRRVPKELGHDYISRFMIALKRPATPARHANVLMHLMGYLKKELDTVDKAEMLELIHAYRQGVLPLASPLTLLKHHFRRYPDPYIVRQTYLHPDPREWLLRTGL